MNMYRKYAPRKEGKGLNILKFHHLSHLWWVIRLFGSLLNVDGARGESNNKFLAKDDGKTTQRHHKTLNLQTAQKSYQKNLILNEIRSKMYLNFKGEETEEATSTRQGHFPHGSKFRLLFDYETSICHSQWIGPKKEDRYCRFPQLLLKSVFFKLEGYNGGTPGRKISTMTGFTEYFLDDIDKTLVRACPNFRGGHDWYDWVHIEWNKNHNSSYNLPAQILLMLDTSTISYKKCTIDEGSDINHDPLQHKHIAFIQNTSMINMLKARQKYI